MTYLTFNRYPEISIILPTYNRAQHLNRCIDSVLTQTFQDWELIVVDDGGTDDTFNLVDAYLQVHPNIRYLKHQNRKPGYSRNAGIQVSMGQYITFIDSDDAYLPNHLESKLTYLKQHPDLDLIEGCFVYEGDIFVVDYFDNSKVIDLKDCVVGPTFFGKRSVFFELGGFNDIPYCEDTEFWHRAEQKFKTQKLTEPQTYLYTRAQNSVTKSFLEKVATDRSRCSEP